MIEYSIKNIEVIIYAIGCLITAVMLFVRYYNGKANLWETMYSPMIILLSWAYVIIAVIHYIDKKN